MAEMTIRFEMTLPDGGQLGSDPCACGSCHPTATVYRDDPRSERHDPRLAEGPCCCGRFFVVAETDKEARARAAAMAAVRRADGLAPNDYDVRLQRVALPWDTTVVAAIAEPRPARNDA